MKLSKLKTAVKILKPFYEDENISLSFKTSGSKITSIVARNKKVEKEFKIVKDDILKSFKAVEKFFAKI